MKVLAWLGYVKKAIAGGLAAGVTAGTVAIADGKVSQEDIYFVVGAFVVGAFAVYFPTNGPRPTPAPTSLSNPKGA